MIFGNGNSILYDYGADGTKLRTVHTTGSTTLTTDYCGNAVYENGVLKMLLNEAGYVSFPDKKYHFYLKDHLGNIRVVADKDGTVEETNSYYPFGGMFTSVNSVQPYKYNGKELERKNGLNCYDYGARQYDAVLGRWTTVDPMSEKYSSTSSYVYCNNNPMKYIDPTGMYFDEANEKKAQKIEKKLDKRISKLEKRVVTIKKEGEKVGELNDRITELKNSKSDISDMRGNQNTEFRYARASTKNNPAGRGRSVTYPTGLNDVGHNVVTMYTDGGINNQIHESRHGGQIARAEYGFDQNMNPTAGFGIGSEVSAYTAQYSYDGKLDYIDAANEINQRIRSTGIIPPVSTVTNIQTITPDFVRNRIGEFISVEINGNKFYGLKFIYGHL